MTIATGGSRCEESLTPQIALMSPGPVPGFSCAGGAILQRLPSARGSGKAPSDISARKRPGHAGVPGSTRRASRPPLAAPWTVGNLSFVCGCLGQHFPDVPDFRLFAAGASPIGSPLPGFLPKGSPFCLRQSALPASAEALPAFRRSASLEE